ncbi:MAG: ArsR/SmtB family transcription factor [Candidatus Thorarchaeota archaeon]|jgi:predicted transcriptional regulator
MSSEAPDELDKVFKALGHLTRRRILRLLAQNPRYPYELSKLLDLNRRVVLKHLDALQEAGLVSREHGQSDLGPDRTYYKLKVSFGLSTTILPNTFVVRMTQRGGRRAIAMPPGFKIPEVPADVRAVKRLLDELTKVNKKLVSIDDERMRYVSLRGQIIQRIESIMEEQNWDQQSCQRVRALLNPVRTDGTSMTDEGSALWAESLKEALELFENLFKLRGHPQPRKKDKDEKEIEVQFDSD